MARQPEIHCSFTGGKLVFRMVPNDGREERYRVCTPKLAPSQEDYEKVAQLLLEENLGYYPSFEPEGIRAGTSQWDFVFKVHDEYRRLDEQRLSSRI